MDGPFEGLTPGGATMLLSLKKILVPVDLSDASREALRYAAGLAKRLDAQVDVLHVSPPLGYAEFAHARGLSGELFATFARSDAGHAMEAFLAELRELGVEAQGRLEVGDPAEMILKVVQTHRHDIIVMGRHGHGSLYSLLMGSVAETVSRKSPVPVLAIREGLAGEAPGAGGSVAVEGPGDLGTGPQ